MSASPARLFRALWLIFVPALLSACVGARPEPFAVATPAISPAYLALYGEEPDETFPLPATDISEVDPRFLRQEVAYEGREAPGTIVVDTDNRFLFLIQPGGRAIRYGIGVGKQGLAFSGRATVGRKATWPGWTPTARMIARDPAKNGPWAGGMKPGLENPLGARALYLYQGDRDTMFRIHGTSEPWSIGKAVSSGCIRLFNQDVIDLYERVPSGATVVVLPRRFPAPAFDEPDDAPVMDRYEPEDPYL